MGGGNKHKNGIICTFPGCEKTMRTQKFKLHFTKQHLKPGEAYNIEHRRQYEVARDDEYVTDNTIAAAAAAAMKQQTGSFTTASMQISTTYHPTMSTISSLTPAFTSPAGPGSSSSTDSSLDEGESAEDKRLVQHYEDVAQMEEQQRLSTSRTSAASLRLVAQHTAAAASAVDVVQRAAAAAAAIDAVQQSSQTHEAESPSRSSSKRSAAAALELATAATAADDAVDPTRAVLVKYIELMDARYHELVQSMREVIEGQRELIETLRRPVQAAETTATPLEQPTTVAQQIQSQTQLAADPSSRKRRKVTSDQGGSASGASTLL